MNDFLFICLFLGSCTWQYNVQAVQEALGAFHDELFGTSLEDHFKVSSDYRADLLPITEWGAPLEVFVGLNMVNFAGLDVDTGVLRLNAWLRLKWADRRLAFNGTQRFGASWRSDVDHVPVPAEKLWTPDVVHLRAAEEYSAQVTEQLAYLHDTDFLHARGNMYNIFWSRAVHLSKVCNIDLSDFPFDEQNCSFTFASWGHNTRQMVLRKLSEAGDLSVDSLEVLDPKKVESVFSYKIKDVIVGNPVEESYTTMQSQFSEVTFTIVLQRQAHHVVTHVICPAALCVVLSTFTLWLPEKQGERVSYAVTVLFTLLAIITFSSDLRPHSGVSTWLDTFQSFCIVLTSLPLVWTVFFVSSLEVVMDNENWDEEDPKDPELGAQEFPRSDSMSIRTPNLKEIPDFARCCFQANTAHRRFHCQQVDLFLRAFHPLLIFVVFVILLSDVATTRGIDVSEEMFGKAPHLIHNIILLIFFVLLVAMAMRWFVFHAWAPAKSQEQIRTMIMWKKTMNLLRKQSVRSKEPSEKVPTWPTGLLPLDQNTELTCDTVLEYFPSEVQQQLQDLTLDELVDIDESDLNAMCVNLSVKQRLICRRACMLLRMRRAAISKQSLRKTALSQDGTDPHQPTRINRWISE